MIRAYYTDRTLLITGGTGFVGSALIAKTLADLGDEVRRIYVLIRPRRRVDGGQVAPAERLEQLYETALFAPLRVDPVRWDALRAKVVPVTIDERQADLGLADEDRRRLLAEVDTIFNSAATVVFDEPLDISVQANVAGPQALLELAQASDRRVDFVHVSTAYVNGQRCGQIADEELPTNRDMRQIMDAANTSASTPNTNVDFDPEAEVADCRTFCEGVRAEASSTAFVRDLKRDILRQYPRSSGRKMTRTRLESLVDGRRSKWIERRLVDEGLRRGKVRGWTDVYTYTKAMGEQMLVLRRHDVPLVIVRPSIIESSLSDPEPGWITGLKVMDPLLAAYGRGLIPDFPARPDVIIDVIPVDMVVNGCLAAATQANVAKVEVFHIATGSENPVKIGEMFDSVRTHYLRQPMTDIGDTPPQLPAWTYPSLSTFRLIFHMKYLYPIRAKEWMLNNIPGRKASPSQKRFLRSMRVRLQRVLYYIDIYSPYTHLDCQFQTRRTRALFESLPADERDIFSLDVMRIDWKRYIEDIHLPGMRRHVLRDEFSADAVLPEAPQEPGVQEALLQAEDDIDTIPDMVRAACARYPKGIACEFRRDGEWLELRYPQLLEKVESRAASWQGSGLSVGDRTVIVGDNGPDWVVNYLATSFLGATAIPVDPQTSAAEVSRIASFTQAAALIAEPDCLQAVVKVGHWTGRCIEWAGSAELGGTFEEPNIDSSMEASIIFTSGTRTDPRGVVLTHGSLIANLLGLSEVQPLTAHDKRLSLLPLHHGLEFTGGLLLSLWAGATVSYLDTPLNSRNILQTIHDRQVTVLLTVPRILKILIDRVRRIDGPQLDGPNARILRKLRLIVSGGAPLHGDLFDAYAGMGLMIHEGYGVTEASPIITVNPSGASRRGSVGIPLPGVEIHIDAASADSDDGAGEILVRGPVVMRGYLNRQELTEQALRGGWLHTGDIGCVDDDGYLMITGRSRDLIVTGGGKNVYPAEVEELYAELPHVAELAVVGLSSARTLGEEAHGVAVLTSQARELDVGETGEEIRQRMYAISRDLPTYQRIAHIHIWQRPLPRLDDGRVHRQALRLELTRESDVADEVDATDSLAPWEREVYLRVSALSGLEVAEVVAHADAPLDTMINSLMAAELVASLPSADGAGEDAGTTPLLDRTDTSLRQLLDLTGPQSGAQDLATETYWSRVIGQLPASQRRRPLLVSAVSAILKSVHSVRLVGVEKLQIDRPYVLAASSSGDVALADVFAALSAHIEGICLVVEGEDVQPGWRTPLSRWLGDRVVLSRHHNLEAGVRAAATHIGSRRPLLLFPEGTRAAARDAGAFKSGIGLLSLELNALVVPLHIHVTVDGTRIEVGESIDPTNCVPRREQLTSYEVYREIAAHVRVQLRGLAQTQESV